MSSIPGKIDYIKTGKLKVSLSTGHMINFDHWILSEYKCMINLQLNDVVLYQGPVVKHLIIDHDFLDIKDGSYNLQIELEEIADGFESYMGWASPMLHIQGIWIEGIDLQMIMEDHGKCFFPDCPDIIVPSQHMGNIGTQNLVFTTPIYRWLLSHDKYIAKSLSN